MKYLALVCVLVLAVFTAPTTALAQSPVPTATEAGLLGIIQQMITSDHADKDKLFTLLMDTLRHPAPDATNVALEQKVNSLLLAEQARTATGASTEKGGFKKFLLQTVAPMAVSAGVGYLAGRHSATNSSFRNATDLVARMPQPLQNINLSSFSGGSISATRTFVGGSKVNTALNPYMNVNASGGTSIADANPNVNTSSNANGQGGTALAGGGQGGQGGSSSASPFVIANGGQGGGGGLGLGGNSNANANGGTAFGGNSNSSSGSSSYSNANGGTSF